MWPWRKGRFQTPSIIGPGMRVRGQLDSDSEGDLTILGQVEGDIAHGGRLRIGAGAHCISNITAAELEVAGEVHGNVEVQGAVLLRRTARLYGDVRCATLQIEQGALFAGANQMGQTPPPERPQPIQERNTPALAILLEPVGRDEREVLGTLPAPGPTQMQPPVQPARPESPAFYGGFSPAIRTDS